MLKYEFEKLIGAEVSAEDYEQIDFVYTWHPIIDDVEGKKQIAELYKIGGMFLINDMYESAERGMEMSKAIDKLVAERNELNERIKDMTADYNRFRKKYK